VAISVDVMIWFWLIEALSTTGAPVLIGYGAGGPPPSVGRLPSGVEARGLKPSILNYLRRVL
jgi:hypothetical protein